MAFLDSIFIVCIGTTVHTQFFSSINVSDNAFWLCAASLIVAFTVWKVYFYNAFFWPQYIHPFEHEKLSQVELLVVDEAAAIPLPVVKSLLGPYLVFISSTVNGYGYFFLYLDSWRSRYSSMRINVLFDLVFLLRC